YLEKIREHIVLAEQYTRQNNESKAMQEYFSCMPLLRESEEAMAMIILLSASQINSEEIYSYNRKVKTAIEEIYRSEQLDLEEVCRFMVDGLKSQTGKFSSPVLLSNFTFEDTRMGSPFSRRLKNELEQELIRSGNYPIVSEMEFSGNHKDINYILTGTYWEDGTRLRILAILRESSSGKPLASIDGYLPVKWLQEQNLSWKPENFTEAQESRMAFTKDEITEGGLKLDVWTNKGDDSPVFVEGDTLKFYLRVNHPCNVRIINHFADGSKVLLYDNYPVSSSLVNKVIELPKEFICSSPFGVEILQVNAQSREFPPLKTESRYGYDFITDELNVILAKTRGFKPVTNEDLRAENRIVVTTMNDSD
ncbi:MAG: DUF4384 domain-containing protein, partial [Bacteroidetes bacterium]|nr:DUF4384 domain-containing protein [Bacteroidota bacterium]